MSRVGLARFVGAALVGCAVVLAVVSSPVGASDDDPLQSGDPRAVAHDGNATTCADAGLPGDIVSVDATGDGTHLTIVGVPEGVTLTGVVVKGGPAYNVYPGDAREDLHAPVNRGGNVPQISHWFACGVMGEDATPSEQPTSPGPGGGSEETSPATPGPEASATGSMPVPAPAGPSGGPEVSNGVNDRDLAQTGVNGWAGLGLGLLLLAAGTLLLAVPRRIVRPAGRTR